MRPLSVAFECAYVRRKVSPSSLRKFRTSVSRRFPKFAQELFEQLHGAARLDVVMLLPADAFAFAKDQFIAVSCSGLAFFCSSCAMLRQDGYNQLLGFSLQARLHPHLVADVQRLKQIALMAHCLLYARALGDL